MIECYVEAEQQRNLALLQRVADPAYRVTTRQLLPTAALWPGRARVSVYNDPKVGDYAWVTVHWPSGRITQTDLDIPDPEHTEWAVAVGTTSGTAPRSSTGGKHSRHPSR